MTSSLISQAALRRKTEIVDAKKAHVMRAAEDVFSERGYASTTMEEIAHRAGYSVGALYNFFPGKRELYFEVLTAGAQSLFEEQMLAYEMGGSTLTLLHRAFKTRVNLFWKSPKFFRLFFHQLEAAVADYDAGFEKERTRRYGALRKKSESILESGQASGEIVACDLKALNLGFELMTRGYVAELCRTADPVRDEKQEEALFSLYARGVATPAAYSDWEKLIQ